VLLERPGSVQSTLRLGRPGIAATSPDYVPMRLASTILGGGFSSRVNQNLREDKGYTYGASAGGRSYRNGGGIVGELVPEDELAMNKRYVAGGYLINNQMQGAVAATLASNWLVGLPPEFLGQYVPLVQKVSAEQVREVGRKYFDPATQSIVVVGDKAAVSEQLKPYGEFQLAQ
jgi:zinc protease